MKLISIREIADNNTSISSTRWAFASVIKFDLFIAAFVVIAGVVAHFIPSVEDFDISFYTAVATLLGVVTGLVAGPKALQGFEPKKDKPSTSKTEEKVQKENKTQKEEIAVG